MQLEALAALFQLVQYMPNAFLEAEGPHTDMKSMTSIMKRHKIQPIHSASGQETLPCSTCSKPHAVERSRRSPCTFYRWRFEWAKPLQRS